jgi:dTDP-4-amino-4,6-dideoxygalactose transaminase
VTTDDEGLAERVRALGSYGARGAGEYGEGGTNSRLAELQAAVLRVKLGALDEWNARRGRLASAYREALADDETVELPEPDPGNEPVWHLFVVGHPSRDRCREALHADGVETGIHYAALPHFTAPYEGAGPFPVAERLAQRTLSLPMYPQLDERAPGRVASILRRA